MPQEKETEPQPLRPVTIAVVGTGSVAGGPDPIQTGTTAVTPSEHQPNILLVVVSPLFAIFVRFMNTFLTTLVGLVTAGMATNILPAQDFYDLVIVCGKLSVAGAGLGAIKDFVTIFAKLEAKFPLLTGKV